MNLHLGLSCALMIGLIIWWGGQAHLQGAVLGLLASRALTLPIVIAGIVKATKRA